METTWLEDSSNWCAVHFLEICLFDELRLDDQEIAQTKMDNTLALLALENIPIDPFRKRMYFV